MSQERILQAKQLLDTLADRIVIVCVDGEKEIIERICPSTQSTHTRHHCSKSIGTMVHTSFARRVFTFSSQNGGVISTQSDYF